MRALTPLGLGLAALLVACSETGPAPEVTPTSTGDAADPPPLLATTSAPPSASSAVAPPPASLALATAPALAHCTSALPPLTGYVSLELADQDVANVVDVALEDMNRDGHADVIVTRGGTHAFEAGTVEILYGPHALPSSAPCKEASGAAPARPAWRSCPASSGCERRRYSKLALGDLNGDGCVDVVAGSYQGGAELFFGVPKGSLCDPPAGALLLHDAAPVAAVALVSVDGDADLDIVAARWSGQADDHRAFAPRVYLNEGGSFSTSSTRLLEPLFVHALAVVALDLDGDGARDDVLFGARGVELTPEQREGLWGVGYVRSGADLPQKGQPYGPAGSKTFVDAPFVVGLARLPTAGRPDAVVVSSTVHGCVTETCRDRAMPAAFSWDGATMSPDARIGGLASGNWLPVAVGSLDDDDVGDVALGLPCGDYASPALTPGRLLVLLSDGQPAFLARGALDGQHIIRALTLGDLDPGGRPGSHDFIYGTAVHGPNDKARVNALMRCTPP